MPRSAKGDPQSEINPDPVPPFLCSNMRPLHLDHRADGPTHRRLSERLCRLLRLKHPLRLQDWPCVVPTRAGDRARGPPHLPSPYCVYLGSSRGAPFSISLSCGSPLPAALAWLLHPTNTLIMKGQALFTTVSARMTTVLPSLPAPTLLVPLPSTKTRA